MVGDAPVVNDCPAVVAAAVVACPVVTGTAPVVEKLVVLVAAEEKKEQKMLEMKPWRFSVIFFSTVLVQD